MPANSPIPTTCAPCRTAPPGCATGTASNPTAYSNTARRPLRPAHITSAASARWVRSAETRTARRSCASSTSRASAPTASSARRPMPAGSPTTSSTRPSERSCAARRVWSASARRRWRWLSRRNWLAIGSGSGKEAFGEAFVGEAEAAGGGRIEIALEEGGRTIDESKWTSPLVHFTLLISHLISCDTARPSSLF